ncbi:hypothetical protein DMB38_18000 [Streptomyces sp. WAC 06738]|uniref:hypothetical protein n=1 Tax=Streptomyces sp. WAC 06738 TaxID=2203210 RepID=UPI000F6F00D4|nr:hypothetical protein [Streptomyces sp. WAC 06738]AZM47431.1 hypothetical protein DMB38_18000 [Streptomyces sp. WAC 06738]
MLKRPWIKLLVGALFVISLVILVNTGPALTNGNGVLCGAESMKPDEFCYEGGLTGDGRDYAEMQEVEARTEVEGYVGIGIGVLAIALFVGHMISRPRKPASPR